MDVGVGVGVGVSVGADVGVGVGVGLVQTLKFCLIGMTLSIRCQNNIQGVLPSRSSH